MHRMPTYDLYCMMFHTSHTNNNMKLNIMKHVKDWLWICALTSLNLVDFKVVFIIIFLTSYFYLKKSLSFNRWRQSNFKEFYVCKSVETTGFFRNYLYLIQRRLLAIFLKYYVSEFMKTTGYFDFESVFWLFL